MSQDRCHLSDIFTSPAISYYSKPLISGSRAKHLDVCGVLREHIQEFCAAPSYANSPNKGLIPVPFLCHSLTRPNQLFATPHATKANQPDDR